MINYNVIKHVLESAPKYRPDEPDNDYGSDCWQDGYDAAFYDLKRAIDLEEEDRAS